MDESLSRAAQAGYVKDLYRLIQGNGNVLRRIDEVEFADTPLHIAAREGHIDFAMEMMILKPSFARKLNEDGLSPIHLAVKKGHHELVSRFLEVDKDLVRVKGKKGKTPLHCLIKEGNCDDLLARSLKDYPESIRDVTTKNQTVLHIAVKNNRLDALQVLIRALRKTNHCQEVVNRKDKDGNTALHIAAGKNQHKMIKLLLKCKADMHVTNNDGSTALEVAKQFHCRECVKYLRGCFIPRVSKYKYMLKKQIIKYVGKASTIIFHDMDNISSGDRNALLVVLGLLLTATFQASISPPGGVSQGDDSSEYSMRGRSVLDETSFLLYYVPTCAVFLVTFFLTLALLKPFPRGFRSALQILLSLLAICFNMSISIIAPPIGLSSAIIDILSVVLVGLMMLMCISYRVSRISVLILACWLLPSVENFILFLRFDNTTSHLMTFSGMFWLFIFPFINNFLEGTVVVLQYCLYIIVTNSIFWRMKPILVLGCWLAFSLFRFSIQWFNEYCPVLCMSMY